MDSELVNLVERARDGDRIAFTDLVERHRRVAAGVAYGILKEEHLAADAVQDAFFKAFQGLARLKEADRFIPWLLSIVRSTATDLVRRQVRWGTRELTYGDELPNGGVGSLGSGSFVGPAEALDRREVAAKLGDALDSLPDDYREVIILKYMEGRSYREISRLLKLSVRAVESRLFRARQQLNRKLNPREPGQDDVSKSDAKTEERRHREPSSIPNRAPKSALRAESLTPRSNGRTASADRVAPDRIEPSASARLGRIESGRMIPPSPPFEISDVPLPTHSASLQGPQLDIGKARP